MNGLHYYPDIVSDQIETLLLNFIDSQPWNNSISRRTQHYGYEYSYTGKALDKSKYTPMPDLLKQMCDYLFQNKLMSKVPDQCIVNEYLRNQGISAHIDNTSNFGPEIVSVSLNADVIMNFINNTTIIPFLLQRRSAVLLTGEARYQWKHEIPKTVTYSYNGVKYTKPDNYRRISLTFRSVI